MTDITSRMMQDRAKMGYKSEADEIAELQALGINHPARRRHRERDERRQLDAKERQWNRTTLRSRPSNLAGMRVVTKEPWALDEAFYQKKTGSLEYEFNSKGKYDDRSALSASKGYTATVTSTGLGGVSQPTWDSSPNRPVPHALKGLKPVTREPWSVDAQINRNMDLEGFDTFSAKVENDSVAGNMAYWNAQE